MGTRGAREGLDEARAARAEKREEEAAEAEEEEEDGVLEVGEGVEEVVVVEGRRKSCVMAARASEEREHQDDLEFYDERAGRRRPTRPPTSRARERADAPIPMLASPRLVLSHARNVRSLARWSRATLPRFSSSNTRPRHFLRLRGADGAAGGGAGGGGGGAVPVEAEAGSRTVSESAEVSALCLPLRLRSEVVGDGGRSVANGPGAEDDKVTAARAG